MSDGKADPTKLNMVRHSLNKRVKARCEKATAQRSLTRF